MMSQLRIMDVLSSPTTMSAQRTILVADDDPNDICLLQRAFQKAGADVHIECVQDGEEAISYLKSHDGHVPDELPELVLLDIKMPRMNGFEVLDWIRRQPRFRRLLTIVLTSSDEPTDINRAYDLGANSYLVKPCSIETLTDIAQHLYTYWMNINRRPDIDPIESERVKN